MLLSGQGIGEMLRRESWQEFRRPLFVMTGSANGPTRTGQPAVWRKQPYELSPPGDKYLVWVGVHPRRVGHKARPAVHATRSTMSGGGTGRLGASR